MLAEYGAEKVYVGESADFDDFLVAPKAEALAQLATSKSPAAVLVAASADSREVAARAAVKAGGGFLWDAVDVTSDLKATQGIFGGGTIVTSHVKTRHPVHRGAPQLRQPRRRRPATLPRRSSR